MENAREVPFSEVNLLQPLAPTKLRVSLNSGCTFSLSTGTSISELSIVWPVGRIQGSRVLRRESEFGFNRSVIDVTGGTKISMSFVLRGCRISNRLRSSNFVHHFIVVGVRLPNHSIGNLCSLRFVILANS